MSYQGRQFLFPMMGAKQSYISKVLSYSPTLYWPLNEVSGTTVYDYGPNGINVSYAPAGITLGQSGIGDGETAAEFDGNNTYVLIANVPAIDAQWDGDKGSMAIWNRVDGLARWTDNTTFRYGHHWRSNTDATYYIVVGGRYNANHTIFWRRRAGGPILEKTYAFAPSGPTDWFFMGLTYDIVADTFSCYVGLDGVLTTVYSGSFGGVGNGAWGVNPVAQPGGNTTLLAAGSLTLQEWIGRLAHAAYWKSVVLSQADMQALATV